MRTNWTFLGWYYHREGRHIGPFPPEEITRLVAYGELRACDEVLQAWRDENSRTRYFAHHADCCGRESGRRREPAAV